MASHEQLAAFARNGQKIFTGEPVATNISIQQLGIDIDLMAVLRLG